MTKHKPSDFEIAFYVENNLRTAHEDKVDKGTTNHVTHNLQEWLVDPSRRDFSGVDTHDRRSPSKSYKGDIPQIRKILHDDYDGIFQDTYWTLHHKKGKKLP